MVGVLFWTLIDCVLHCCNGICTWCSRPRVVYLVQIPLSPPQPPIRSFPGQWRLYTTHLQYCGVGKKKNWLHEYCDLLLWYIGWSCSMCNNFPSVLESNTIIASKKCVPSGGWMTGNKSCQGLVARVGDCQQLIKVFSFQLGGAFFALDLGYFLLLSVYSFVCFFFLSFFIHIYCKV